MARFVLPPLLRWAAKSPEIVLISAISWCLLIGYLAILADFSIAMGALIAGVTLSALPYTLDVVAKIRGLRDFFVTLFFVALGHAARARLAARAARRAGRSRRSWSSSAASSPSRRC